MQHQRQRASAEEVPVHLELGQRVAELPNGRGGGLVHEHLVGPRVSGDT